MTKSNKSRKQTLILCPYLFVQAKCILLVCVLFCLAFISDTVRESRKSQKKRTVGDEGCVVVEI